MSLLDTLIFGYRTIQSENSELPARNKVSFGPSFTVTDDPDNDRTVITGGGGGGSVPTGTGFTHVTGGSQDAASKLVELDNNAHIDFTKKLGVAQGGTGLTSAGSALQYLRTNAGASALEWATLPDPFVAPTGTGFATVTGGVLDAASRKVDLSSSTWVQNTLAIANGGTGLSSLGPAKYGLVVNDAGTALQWKKLTSLPEGWYRPEDYGAVGDYSFSTHTGTDDLAAFDAMLAAIKADSSRGNANQTAVIWLSRHYYLSGRLVIGQTVTMLGPGWCEDTFSPTGYSSHGASLVFATDDHGIWVEGPYDTGRGARSHFQGFALLQNNIGRYPPVKAPGESGCGIYSATVIYVRDLYIAYWADDAIRLEGGIGGGETIPAAVWWNIVDDPPVAARACRSGAVTGSSITDCYITLNAGHGLFLYGTDSNVCTFTNLMMLVNGGWGVVDGAANGMSTYVGIHCEGNWGTLDGLTNHDYKNVNSGTSAHTFVGCYTEAATNELYAPANAIGNELGASLTHISNGGGAGQWGELMSRRLVYNYESTIYGPSYTNTYVQFGSGNQFGVEWSVGAVDNSSVLSCLFNHATQTPSLTTFITQDDWYTFALFPGHNQRPTRYAPVFLNGVSFGNLGAVTDDTRWNKSCAIDYTWSSALDNASDMGVKHRTFAQGDITFRRNATSGQNMGWICTVPGTLGAMTGMTIDTVNGSDIVTLNTAGTYYIKPGDWIAAGDGILPVTQYVQVIDEVEVHTHGVTFRVRDPATSTVTGLACSLYPPTNIPLANIP